MTGKSDSTLAQDAYVTARQELADVREELEEVSTQMLTAAEQVIPGIGDRFAALQRREEYLRRITITAAVGANYL